METWRAELYFSNELYHHGIKGMKWGVRRYQNEDGSLTAAGLKRYAGDFVNEKVHKDMNYRSKTTRSIAKTKGTDSAEYKRSAQLDREISKRYQNMTRAQDLVQSVLLGKQGQMTYNMARASGYGQVRSVVKSYFDLSVEDIVGVAAQKAAGYATRTVGRGLSNAGSAVSGKHPGVGKVLDKAGSAIKSKRGQDIATRVAGSAASDAYGSYAVNNGIESSIQQQIMRGMYASGKSKKHRNKAKAKAR